MSVGQVVDVFCRVAFLLLLTLCLSDEFLWFLLQCPWLPSSGPSIWNGSSMVFVVVGLVLPLVSHKTVFNSFRLTL